MSHVARPIASDSSIHEEAARVIEICVASAAAYTFTRLLPTRIVISNLSVCDFICARAFEPKSFCFTRESSLWFGKLIRAISVPEKNQERIKRKTKSTYCQGSINSE